jgi:hypothetical protein
MPRRAASRLAETLKIRGAFGSVAGRQDAALYGRRDARRYTLSDVGALGFDVQSVK